MNRKLLARLVLVAGVALVGAHLFATMPRQVDIRYRVGADHDGVTDARFAYTSGGEEMEGVAFHYAYGAPAVVRHQVRLPPGDYGVVASLSGPGVDRSVKAKLEVPADGIVRIDLGQQ